MRACRVVPLLVLSLGVVGAACGSEADVGPGEADALSAADVEAPADGRAPEDVRAPFDGGLGHAHAIELLDGGPAAGGTLVAATDPRSLGLPAAW